MLDPRSGMTTGTLTHHQVDDLLSASLAAIGHLCGLMPAAAAAGGRLPVAA